jgi:hypothetical protein
MGRPHHDDGRSRRRIDVSSYGGKTCKGDNGEDVRRLCAAERTVRFRLRSAQLVHDVHLRKRPIDPGAILALLPAKRLVPGPALLKKPNLLACPQCPFGA